LNGKAETVLVRLHALIGAGYDKVRMQSAKYRPEPWGLTGIAFIDFKWLCDCFQILCSLLTHVCISLEGNFITSTVHLAHATGYLYNQTSDLLPRPCCCQSWQHDNKYTSAAKLQCAQTCFGTPPALPCNKQQHLSLLNMSDCPEALMLLSGVEHNADSNSAVIPGHIGEEDLAQQQGADTAKRRLQAHKKTPCY
jgi:hypothetical protein